MTCEEVVPTNVRSSTRSFVKEKFSHARKLVKTEPEHRRTLQLNKPTGSDIAAPQGCPKCIHARDHGWGKAGGPHSQACVERFRKGFEATEESKRKLTEVDTRITVWLGKQVERADHDPTAREPDVPMRFEDLEEAEIPVQEEQSQSIPITQAPGARGVRGVIGIRADEVLTETPPRDADDVSLEADDRDQEYEIIANYAPTDAEDEEITLLQPIMNLAIEGVIEADRKSVV